MELAPIDTILGKIGIKTQAYRVAEALSAVDAGIADTRLELAYIEMPDIGRSEVREELDEKLYNLMLVKDKLNLQRLKWQH